MPTRSCAVANCDAWARRTRASAVSKHCATAFAHPYKSDRGDVTNSQKEIGPCFGSGPGGRPRSSSSVSLAIEGDGAPQGAWPGLRQTGPGARDSRAGPDRRALGVKRHAPRLAAHQRGIFAFRRLTVVRTGPARSGRRGCPSTARGRWLRKSFARRCRSRSPPSRRLMSAPLVEWIGMAET